MSSTATTAASTTIRARFRTLPGYVPFFLAIVAFVGTSLRTLSTEMARLSTLEAAVIATVFRSPPASSSSPPLTTSATPAVSSATTSTATSISFQGDEVAIFTLKLLLRWLVVLLLITADVAAILFVIIVVIIIIIFIVGILFVLAFNAGSGRCLLVSLFFIRRFLLIFCIGFYGHRIFIPLWIVAVLFVIITVIILIVLLFLVIFSNSIYRRRRCFLRNLCILFIF